MKIKLKFNVVMVAVAASLLTACGGDDKEVTETLLRPVKTIEVTSGQADGKRVFAGTARAGIESKLSFKVEGTIQELTLVVGDKTKKDQLMASLDTNDYLLKVQEAEASLEKGKAEERNAKANYERIRALYENRNASLNELDSARAAFESSRAAVRSINKQLELANSQLSYTQLLAPGECRVADVKVELNENVQAGQEIFSLVCGQRAEVKVSVPEAFIAAIAQGDSVEVVFDSVESQVFAAKVTEVGVATGDFSTTYPVIVTLDKVHRQIRSGMAAEVTFNLQTESSQYVILVPASAVLQDQTGHYVYTLSPTTEGRGTVKRKNVTIGEINNQGIEILSGLLEGEQVITAGVSRISDGQEVKN